MYEPEWTRPGEEWLASKGAADLDGDIGQHKFLSQLKKYIFNFVQVSWGPLQRYLITKKNLR